LINMIFGCLDLELESVKNVRLVSRLWMSIIEKPEHWRLAKLRLQKTGNSSIAEVMSSRVAQLVEVFWVRNDITETGDLQNILRPIASCKFPRLKKLFFQHEENLAVGSRLLASALTEVEHFKLEYISRRQISGLLKKIVKKENLRLKRLTLFKIRLTDTSPDILVRAISRLEKVGISEAQLTPSHLYKLFHDVGQGQLPLLRCLSIGSDDASSIPPDILAKSLTMLEMVDYEFLELTIEQLIAIYRLIAERKQGKLQSIMTSGNMNKSLLPTELREAAWANKEVDMVGG